MAVPARTELLADLAQKSARLIGALDRMTQSRGNRLQAAGARLPDLPAIVGTARMRLDDRGQRLALVLPNVLAAGRAALVRAERHIPQPGALIAARRGALGIADVRLLAGLRRSVQLHRDAAGRMGPRLTPAFIVQRLRDQRSRLDIFAARLEAASYERVLARGFALVRDAGGHAVTQAGQVTPGARLKLVFADGKVGVVAEGRQARLPF
jgi:exodeoxyribonuclease VII large subunit